MDGALVNRRVRLFTPAGLRRRPGAHLLFFVVVMAVAWEAASLGHLLRTDTWPPPSEIGSVLWHDLWVPENTHLGDPNRALPLSAHVVLTLRKWLLGFCLSILGGVWIGAALGTSRTMFALGFPAINVLRALPSAAVWPICVLIVGLGASSQLATIVFGAIWPILLGTLNTLTSLSPEIRDSMEFMQLSGRQRLQTQLQWALPGILTGVELSCSVAFLLAVTVEVFDTSGGGIGWYMDFHKQTSEYAAVFGGVVLTGALGWLLNSIVHLLRGILLFWERGATSHTDVLYRKLRMLIPRRRRVTLANRIADPRLRALLTTDQVSDALDQQFLHWRFEVLYYGAPYFWPAETEALSSISTKAAICQRDIRISVRFDDAAYRPVLFAQSWLDVSQLSEDGRNALQARSMTLGQIIRQHERERVFLRAKYLDNVVSEKLGIAFRTNGAVETVKRVRVLTARGRPAGVVHEYVPILLGDAPVYG